MNRFSLVLVGVLTTLLASCNVYVSPPNGAVPNTPDLNVSEATYTTSFSLPGGQPVICDDQATQIVYQFRYEGILESWSSYLQGQTLGKISGEETFTPESAGVSPYEASGFEVTYTLSPNTAPYASSPEAAALAPQGIEVTPVPNATRIGAAKLHLTLRGADGEAEPYRSQDIPVYINCF